MTRYITPVVLNRVGRSYVQVDALTIEAYERFASGSANIDDFMVTTALTKSANNSWYPGISFAGIARLPPN